ncbi:uncharacterized protein LOC110730716 [Chenopodium quinoa]|uniref:uncharacterized protein LOC110730716 n=1 Tax=Chenopodium quinoa TaxID=63459 RepID=UPI000B7756DD|nr:uncharacterized protein LOC110730716 [Chenopodium quinoa]
MERREKILSTEEEDQMRRSNEKFKRTPGNSPETQPDPSHGGQDTKMGTCVEETREESSQFRQKVAHSNMAKRNGGERALFSSSDSHGGDDESDDALPLDCDSDDESCPNILLTKEEKQRLRKPWQNALIIKLFEKKLSYEVLMKRLTIKWSLKGELSLTDLGLAYYIARFTNMEDYHFVLTQGPWLIGDSYLTIRKWVPNFVADEAPIKFLTAWVRIPQLSIEYFDKQFWHKIGSKIGKVISIDRNTEAMSRGQYIRFSIEVDLSKPLLSKFRLNGRVWRI